MHLSALVALLAEGVDRNIENGVPDFNASVVALLAEGVDRNQLLPIGASKKVRVALLAEGVDRNTLFARVLSRREESPSSRRAWIEITMVQ